MKAAMKIVSLWVYTLEYSHLYNKENATVYAKVGKSYRPIADLEYGEYVRERDYSATRSPSQLNHKRLEPYCNVASQMQSRTRVQVAKICRNGVRRTQESLNARRASVYGLMRRAERGQYHV